LKVAIIGMPQSGKTTLAAAATGVAPPPAVAAQVHHAVVKVPDERLNTLADIFKPKKVTQATIELIDVPGFSLADHRGRDELHRFLPEIRQADLLMAVVRAFDNSAVPAYRDRVDPQADINELCDEFLLADLETITTRLEKLQKSVRKPTKSADAEKRELAVLAVCNEALEQSKPISSVLTKAEDQAILSSFGLLTLKPLLVVRNVSEEDASAPDPPSAPSAVATLNVSALTERDIAELDPADRPSFLADLGVTQPASDRLIQQCYESLGLVSFLTAGADEVRAWTIDRGTDAVTAAGKIHSDIARGFIRAETVAYDDFMEAGDMKAAKSAGKVRQEGKTYIVKDGDIINFKFNV